jgi:hypothetical protein
MNSHYAEFEAYVPGKDDPRWSQSYYYNAYDPASGCGALIRVGLLENKPEANSWLIVFQNGLPIFARTNLNLPYTPQRPAQGLEIAGMRIHAEVPLKKTRIGFCSPDFSMDLLWDELHPLEDCIAMSQDKDGAFAREMAHIHLEGTSTVSGKLIHRGKQIAFKGKGFRDIAAGPRNWDALEHYRLAWPVFDNGMAFAGIHGISTGGQSAYMRMFHDGTQWRRVKQIDDKMNFAADGLSVTSAHWSFVDELDRKFELSAKPIFHWLFPLDTFVLCEQIMEFRLGDGTLGYGLYETGYRLPRQNRNAA